MVELSEKLHFFPNLVTYFYRFIGTEKFALNFATYEKIIELLEQATLHDDPEKNVLFKKKLLPLLALSITGPRVLKEGHDLLSDLGVFLTHIKEHGSEFLDTRLLSYINYKHSNLEPKPTLFELTALLKLSHEPAIIDGFFDRIKTQGEVLYSVMTNLSQGSSKPDALELELFFQYLDKLPQAHSEKNTVLLLLASITQKENWVHLCGLITDLDRIKNPEVLTHLIAVLETINSAEKVTDYS